MGGRREGVRVRRGGRRRREEVSKAASLGTFMQSSKLSSDTLYKKGGMKLLAAGSHAKGTRTSGT